MTAISGLVPDSHTFCEAGFSCRELIRFARIALVWPIAARILERQSTIRTIFESLPPGG